jgi:vacuolar-type H+-ATPase subunit D/Vma8
MRKATDHPSRIAHSMTRTELLQLESNLHIAITHLESWQIRSPDIEKYVLPYLKKAQQLVEAKLKEEQAND